MNDLPILLFPDSASWAAWLRQNHATSPGIWLRIAKKSSTAVSLSYPQALQSALCYGWIDGQTKSEGPDTWLKKFIPRARRSIWSKVNREKALALLESGQMQPSGLAEIKRAQADGRWDAAYDAQRAASTPDFDAALAASPQAKAFYAFHFRIQTAKKPETRARRIRQFIAMLEDRKKPHPGTRR